MRLSFLWAMDIIVIIAEAAQVLIHHIFGRLHKVHLC
jgi:hypothetical protein